VDIAPGPGAGPVDVLIGIDGSVESEAALRTAVEILGPRIGRLTLVGVTGFDYGNPQVKSDTEHALETLRGMAASASVAHLGITILSGRPADALRSTRCETVINSSSWAVGAAERARRSSRARPHSSRVHLSPSSSLEPQVCRARQTDMQWSEISDFVEMSSGIAADRAEAVRRSITELGGSSHRR
jgi:hypothetical protein